MEETGYVESSIAISRNYQEHANCIQGVTGYGKLACLIGSNMDYLDSFAEYVALCVSNNVTRNAYKTQYGEGPLSGMIRGFSEYSLELVNSNEKSRRNAAFLSGLLTEACMKYGIREIKILSENKGKQKYFEKVFFVLKSYLEENDQYVFYDNANRELKKILKSFPVDSKIKQQLWKAEWLDDYNKISEFADKIDDDAKRSLAYLLYAIHAQKYGEQFENTEILRNYYAMLGYKDYIINKIITENREAYSIVAFDQKRYLSLARGMVKQFSTNIPNLDINRMTQRAVEMSKYDPYYSRHIDMRSHSTYHSQKTISDIFFDKPETVIDACRTAVSQIALNDNIKENLEMIMKSWNIDSDVVMGVLNQADKYRADIIEED